MSFGAASRSDPSIGRVQSGRIDRRVRELSDSRHAHRHHLTQIVCFRVSELIMMQAVKISHDDVEVDTCPLALAEVDRAFVNLSDIPHVDLFRYSHVGGFNPLRFQSRSPLCLEFCNDVLQPVRPEGVDASGDRTRDRVTNIGDYLSKGTEFGRDLGDHDSLHAYFIGQCAGVDGSATPGDDEGEVSRIESSLD
jgi:hypothetical protein